ncbi:hypothetical protein LVD15_25060 [Fulvivirga maritima]|uniref:hypothetical protein n=1 Tax=Fulvivirga maritima TaxID=2904247 RepID=UPI001F3E2BE6|nr:hypothetical protein [Fulvivirga maritima]UII26527.1 hypothetical protein LVD15_25060 [Fulvivirga maritima]
MNIQNQLISLADKYSLKKKALDSIDEVINAHVESDNVVGIDYLEGNNRSDLIYEFDRYELQLELNGISRISTKINIYSKKLYGKNIDLPVGCYEAWTDLEGQDLDDFLTFDWSLVNLNAGYFIERINKTVPQRYFKRNVQEYEFATYVNHIISLLQGRQYVLSIIFIKRSLDYLENKNNKGIEDEYLNECLMFFEQIYHYVGNHNLLNAENIDRYKIYDRIRSLKLTVGSKTH